ncbi:MAG: GNAT family N-acetyltransferase [Cyclobacteriaceae bacterium]
MIIRQAELSDLPALADSARSFFDSAFSADNDPVVMQEYMDSAFTIERFTQEFQEQGSAFFLAVENNKIFGYARLRMNPEVDQLLSGSTIELQRFYLNPSAWGTGLSDDLMHVCLDFAHGIDWMWLGVWEKNPRALKFYARYAFKKFSEHTFMMGNEAQIDLLMCRRMNTI